MSDKRIPITRVNKFFGSEDFKLQESLGMEYLHGNLNFTLVLFRVDKRLSDVDDVYGEAGPEEIRYKPPVEFNAYVKIDTPNNKSYGGGLVNQMEPGNMTLGVYIKHLEELDIDINYGDYIGYPEKEDVMSLYKFKLAGLISGKDNSYISLVNSGGEIMTVTIGQFLGKIKLVDLRLNEAIFEKEDKSFMIIDFNNVIREADEY